MGESRRINKLLDLATKLVRLSTSPVEHEAKAAALRACQLIDQHRFLLIDSERWEQMLVEHFELEERAEDLQQRLFKADEEIGRLRAEAAERKKKGKPEQALAQSEPLLITSKWDATCKSCGGRIHKDDPICWRPKFGAWHRECPAPEPRPEG